MLNVETSPALAIAQALTQLLIHENATAKQRDRYWAKDQLNLPFIEKNSLKSTESLYAERDIAGLLQTYVEQEELRLQKIRHCPEFAASPVVCGNLVTLNAAPLVPHVLNDESPSVCQAF
ncbi:hypothetical protein RRG08_009249 [Elysia crispata]|uniref:Uncharacterized protein n=1 Tax=Elysia crispata TaxID=231223 RepID=A0AAE1E771_9GAST|nr:hypothetical protein RRG08_009249 [Elysia crispata]